MTIWSTLAFALVVSETIHGAAIAPASKGWHFVQNGTSGIVALEGTIVAPNLALFFDWTVNDNPLTTDDGVPAWGALWNLETNVATPLKVVSNTFCASGGFLSNGTMVSVGGTDISIPGKDEDGRMGIRIFEPCTDRDGVGCTLFDNPDTLHLVENRWYPTAVRIFDGSLIVVGGTHNSTPFYNVDPASSFEFFPPKAGGIRPSPFLERSVPVNLFPRVFALPDGKLFMVANNQSIIYDVETQEETILPDLPNGVRVTNPLDGTAVLLPLSPPNYTPEVLVCGGSNASDTTPTENLSSQTPASDQCSRITLTKQGIAKGWEVDHALQGHMLSEMLLLPNGQVIIIGGAQTGYAAIASISDPVGNNSNADHPILTPTLYTPSAPLGQRFSTDGLPATDIARMYHSSYTLTPNGNILIAGSNPNVGVILDDEFHSEYRVETLNPPFMTVPRPSLSRVPQKVAFNSRFTIPVDIPATLKGAEIKVALMDLGFSTHSFHTGARLVFLKATLSPNRKTLTVQTPPNNRVYPPGPAWLFLTVDDVTSVGAQVMLGNGATPPVQDQGVRI